MTVDDILISFYVRVYRFIVAYLFDGWLKGCLPPEVD